MKQALLVIDVQESFRHRPYWNAKEAPAFLANVQALIDRCKGRGIPVLQIFHQELTHDAADPFTAENHYHPWRFFYPASGSVSNWREGPVRR